VPKEQALLKRGEVRGGLLGNAFEGKGLSSAHHVVEGTDDRKRGLTMVGNDDTIAVGQFKIGGVPFENKPSTLVFSKKDLRTK
jgi:hypothetical protein